MAELPKDIRKPNGDVVSVKRPYGRRLLLPTEVELCKLLGLSEDEYWLFVDKTAAYNGQRPKGYELIPDIRCDPVTTWFAANIVNIGIAVAAATVSYLLTPKPKEQKQGGSRRTADAIGNAKFAPQSSFNSVQSLAQIGDAIPLVFTNQTTINNELFGGIRVNSQLLWSQFVSLGKYQQLKALALFSHGTIGAEPEYEGYAVGDTLLNTYNAYKVKLYFKDGSNSGDNRIVKGDAYSKSKLIIPSAQDRNDPFEVGVPNQTEGSSPPKLTSKAFSGARNPTTQTSFGVYSPIPNCQICRLPYELIRDPRGADQSSIQDGERKRKKVEFARWPTRAGVIKAGGSTTKGLRSVSEGDKIEYQILGLTDADALQTVYDHENSNGDAFNYRPHGVEDVDSLTTSIRESADNLLTVGEQYLFGTAIVVCESNNNTPAPWTIQATKFYTLRVVESGELDIPVNSQSLSIHAHNPVWYEPPNSSERKDPFYSLNPTTPIYYRQQIAYTELNFARGHRDLYYGWDIYTGQKVALATVSNNRKCDVTEIGIKSTVYKRIQFANVQSQPNEEALRRAWNDRTQIQLGQVSTYADRISLFMLQARKLGDTTWQDLINSGAEHGNNHTGLFAIKGNTPEAQYNAITISHPTKDQYEYRFKPYPGNYITRHKKWGKRFNLLATDGSGTAPVSHFSSNGFDIAFSGDENFTITETVASNKEWLLGESAASTVSGDVISAKLNGATTWEENPNFDGIVTDQRWEQTRNFARNAPDENTGVVIVLWNDTSLTEIGYPHWFETHGYMWQIYGGTITGTQTSTAFPNSNAVWNTVYFEYNGKRYRPADPGQWFHPADVNYPGGNPRKYWVIEESWITTPRVVNPLLHFSGNVLATGGSGTGLRVNLTIQKYEYQTGQFYHTAQWSLDSTSLGSGYQNGETVQIPWTDASGAARTINVQLQCETTSISTRASQNFNPYDVLADWNVFEGDENSNRNNPEHEIVYVNEILKPEINTGNVEQPAKYSDLAFAGIKINSSKEWTNFSQFSAYFKKGIKIYNLLSSSINSSDSISWAAEDSSNLFPEIAYTLLASTKLGAGKLVGVDSIDFREMKGAAKYCERNKFFWDGTISSKLNLRDFIFEHAGYCLLDFTIIGGRFSLRPSIPVDEDKYNASGNLIHNGEYGIHNTNLPEIKCLFTDGNINDLQVSFLSPEERQTFQAVVLYRQEKANGFPETKSVLVREQSPNGSETDPVETFDMSGFCTSRQQALWFAYFAIKSRRLIDHGLTFKTAPQYVEGLSPGDYFRLVSEVTHTNRFRNGAKLDDGTIVSKEDIDSFETVYYWQPGTEGVISARLYQVPNGSLFTVKTTTTEKKVYKCETISYGEDGLLEVSGSYAPTESNGRLSVLQNWGFDVYDPSGFVITETK
tara:strand:+ start:16547 stop:20758 length:4212 start_codon:yes stop_codon:yes gene_type:complete